MSRCRKLTDRWTFFLPLEAARQVKPPVCEYQND